MIKTEMKPDWLWTFASHLFLLQQTKYTNEPHLLLSYIVYMWRTLPPLYDLTVFLFSSENSFFIHWWKKINKYTFATVSPLILQINTSFNFLYTKLHSAPLRKETFTHFNYAASFHKRYNADFTFNRRPGEENVTATGRQRGWNQLSRDVKHGESHQND